ncbi:hypothetical protein [Consotaella salsifontis]|uniref:Helix-turn-helix domain-containing protein n=1 Tax=Consotaella salsifontis TaxID=1365950 RepID=A0A1T4SDU4_9HYPH|nr:hypothetical protein [Consotaella salsifontis]SKA26444.1 hypothetical protein SAMN05428963_11079 [Consotaella salsifontis]
MSARVLKWLGRQTINDRTLTTILRTLAEAADKAGCVSLRQDEIASRALITDRAVRSGLNLLEHFGVVNRQSRGAKKAGRMADLITLAIDRDFAISKEDVSEGRRSGCTTANYRKRGSGCPREHNRNEIPPGEAALTSEKVPDIYIVRARAFNFDAATVKTLKEARARVWKEREKWRARLTYQGMTLDLGRHECRELAEAECRVRLLDMAHASQAKSGTPREPVINSDLQKLEGEALCDWLDSPHPQDGPGRAADRPRVRAKSPGGGVGVKPPLSEGQSSTFRARGAA